MGDHRPLELCTVMLPRLGFALAALALAGSARAQTPPALRLDHVIVYVAEGAPEKAALEKAGFTVAPTVNHHDGQGSSSITVEFLNGYLELLYRDHGVKVSPGMENVADLFDGRSNWRETGFSPFGLQLARTSATPAAFPFPTTKVHADWMGPDENLELLTPRDRPFQLGLSIPPHAVDEAANVKLAADPAKGAVFQHANGAMRITSVEIVAPLKDRLPPAADYVAATGAAKFRVDTEWLMILTLDGGRQGKTADLEPALPLVVKY